jgi:hypothetical protein
VDSCLSIFCGNGQITRVAHGFTDGPVREAPPNRTLDVPHLALRCDHRRGGFRLPQGVCVLDSVLIRVDLESKGKSCRCELSLSDDGISRKQSQLLFLRPEFVLAGYRSAPSLTGANFADLVRIAKTEGRSGNWTG